MYKQCLMQRQCRNVHKRTIQSTATKIDRRRRRNSKRRAQTNKNRPVFGQYMVRVSASENCKTNGKMNDGCNWWLTENGGEIERKRERESGKGHTHKKSGVRTSTRKIGNARAYFVHVFLSLWPVQIKENIQGVKTTTTNTHSMWVC